MINNSQLNSLLSISDHLVDTVPASFTRYLYDQISLGGSMIGIVGPRGVGKTTLLLQLMKNRLGPDDKALYIDLNEVGLIDLSLLDLTQWWTHQGGTHLFLDHLESLDTPKSQSPQATKPPSHQATRPLAHQLEQIHTNFPEIHLVFTCSTVADVDGFFYELSRLADLHFLTGLSFREYLGLHHNLYFPVILYHELIEVNRVPGKMVLNKIHPLPYFEDYLKQGYYPFLTDSEEEYRRKVDAMVTQVLLQDFAVIHRIDYESVLKIKRVLNYLATAGPMRPNVEQLADFAGTSRDSLLKFLKYLHKAGMVGWMTQGGNDINYLNKPDRLLLNNSVLTQAIALEPPSRMHLLETFAFNQLRQSHQLNSISAGGFLVDLMDEFRFQIASKRIQSGPRPSVKARQEKSHSFLVDGHEARIDNKIPFWMLGFLY